MVKIAVMGDRESVKGFAAVGLDIYPCEAGEDAEELLQTVVGAGYGVIYITERIAAVLQKPIAKLNRQLTPSVVPFPGVSGNTGAGVAALKEAVEKAVGSDIIFNK
ncbi:MAG: V-type ATP synthase subunit F [Clostridia bacterium]|nr:V-type ATP synthase subunit F [Clostridia bacterium]